MVVSPFGRLPYRFCRQVALLWIVGGLGSGSRTRIACQADGTRVHGNHRSYKLVGRDGWVSARHVRDHRAVPWCAG